MSECFAPPVELYLLLTLGDIFAKTPTFEAAIKDLPPLDDLGKNN